MLLVVDCKSDGAALGEIALRYPLIGFKDWNPDASGTQFKMGAPSLKPPIHRSQAHGIAGAERNFIHGGELSGRRFRFLRRLRVLHGCKLDQRDLACKGVVVLYSVHVTIMNYETIKIEDPTGGFM